MVAWGPVPCTEPCRSVVDKPEDRNYVILCLLRCFVEGSVLQEHTAVSDAAMACWLLDMVWGVLRQLHSVQKLTRCWQHVLAHEAVYKGTRVEMEQPQVAAPPIAQVFHHPCIATLHVLLQAWAALFDAICPSMVTTPLEQAQCSVDWYIAQAAAGEIVGGNYAPYVLALVSSCGWMMP